MKELQVRKRRDLVALLYLGGVGRKVWGGTSWKTEDNWEVIAGVRWWWTVEEGMALKKESSGWTGAIWEVDV